MLTDTKGLPGDGYASDSTCTKPLNSPMKRSIEALASREFDLLVVGGGIFGACAAWDAALRGLSVALIERDDFSSGVSANSFKMVHGGIRYLQHADLRRLRESCFERSALLRIAPHLVHPLPIAIPTYGHLRQGKPFLGAGMLTYDLLTADRNRGISSEARRIPRTEFLSKKDILDLFPNLDSNGLTGGAVFRDAQMYNPTRLVLAVARSAGMAGAEVANYVEATGFVRNGDAITGARVKDALTGDEFDIRARVTLNAAGPWAESLLDTALPKGDVERGTYSRDTYFVVPRKFEHPYALAVQAQTRDPGAVLSREARHLFVVPWRDHSLIGVWHVVYDRSPDEIVVGEHEIENFCHEINSAYPALALDPGEVELCNAGLVPFGENVPGAVDLNYGKESRLIDHAIASNVSGLVTLIGIRYTMGRGDAAKAIDTVCGKLGRDPSRAPTHRLPVHGGDIGDFEDLVADVSRARKHDLDPTVVRAMIHNYGTAYLEILSLAEHDPSLAAPIDNSRAVGAQVLYAIRDEMAQTLADIVLRRTDIATGQHPGRVTLEQCADIAAKELGWSANRRTREIEGVAEQMITPTA